MEARQFVSNPETAVAVHDVEIQDLQTKYKLLDGRMWAILIGIAGLALEQLVIRMH